jgi:acyl-CoA reductase-like NAD-dependent aldehyde dehydrogenase
MESKSFVRYKYKMESSVFMLKHIVDKFYEDALIYKERIDSLEKKVKQLEEENAKLVSQSKKVEKKKVEVVTLVDNDDDVYANEALAPQASLAPIKEEKPIVIVGNSTTVQEDNKNITVGVDKDRKTYMKEYQRNYRKKQKDLTLNL